MLKVQAHIQSISIVVILVRYGKKDFVIMQSGKRRIYEQLPDISSLIRCVLAWLKILVIILFGMRYGYDVA